MKGLLIGLLAMASVIASASTTVCNQAEGDDYYSLAYDKDAQFMAILHTNDSNESDVVFSDYAEYFPSEKTISGGRYIVNIDGGVLQGHSTLYRLEGKTPVLLTNILECAERENVDINSWIRKTLGN